MPARSSNVAAEQMMYQCHVCVNTIPIQANTNIIPFLEVLPVEGDNDDDDNDDDHNIDDDNHDDDNDGDDNDGDDNIDDDNDDDGDNIQGAPKKMHHSNFVFYFCSRSRILLFHMCFRFRILSPFHWDIQTMPTLNLNCLKNAKNACVDVRFSPNFSPDN